MSAVHISFYPVPEGMEGLFQRFYWELCGEMYNHSERTLALLSEPEDNRIASSLVQAGKSLTLIARRKFPEALDAIKPLIKGEGDYAKVRWIALLHGGFLHLLLENEGMAHKFIAEAEKVIDSDHQPFLLYFLGLLLLKKEDKDTALKALLEARRTSDHPVLKAKITLALLSCNPLPIQEEIILSICDDLSAQLYQQLPLISPHKELSLLTQFDRIIHAYSPHRSNLEALLRMSIPVISRAYDFGLFDRCLQMCQHLLDLAELYATSLAPYLIDIYTFRGQVLSFKKEYERAEKDFKYALFLTKQVQDKARIAKIHLYRSINYFKNKEKEQANEELRLYFENPVENLQSVAMREMGFHAMKKGKVNDAARLVQKSIEVAKTPLEQARSYRVEGMIALRTKDLFRANYALRTSVEQFLAEKNYLEYAKTLRYVAESFALSGDFSSAHDYLDEGIELLPHYGYDIDLPYFYTFKARLYMLKEQLQQAEKWGSKELEISSKVQGETLGYTLLLNAQIKRRSGELKAATSFLHRALQIFKQTRRLHKQAECFLEEALIFAKEKRFNEAHRVVQQALGIYEKDKMLEGQARAHYVRGKIYRKMRQITKAKQSLGSALQITENLLKQQNIDLADIYQEIAGIHASCNEREKAAEYLFSALDIAESLGLENRIQQYLSSLQDISPKSIAQYRLKKLTGSIASQELERMTRKVFLQKQKVTALFVDLRGFTQMIEKIAMERTTPLLHQFYTICSQASSQFGGQLNKFLGDGALFLFPETTSADCLTAIQCALFLKTQLERLTRQVEVQTDFGITLDRGEVALGTFGFGIRQDYTAIGECINIASRLQAFADNGSIVISERMLAVVKDKVEVEEGKEVTIKGISEPINLYTVKRFRF